MFHTSETISWNVTKFILCTTFPFTKYAVHAQHTFEDFVKKINVENIQNVVYAVVTATTGFRFDGRSTAYQRSL